MTFFLLCAKSIFNPQIFSMEFITLNTMNRRMCIFKLAIFALLLPFSMPSVTTKLSIDLTSLEVNPYLNQLCWKELFTTAFNAETITIQSIAGDKTLTVKKIEDPDTKTIRYCISESDKNTYYLKLPLSLSRDPNSLMFRFRFDSVLAPSLKIIRFQIVHGGVHFKLNNVFGGVKKELQFACQVLLKFSINNRDFRLRIFKLTHDTFQQLEPGTYFDFFYSCFCDSLSTTSSAFIRGSGRIPTDTDGGDFLNLLVLIPFRRFLFVSFKPPPESEKSVFELVILNQQSGQCLKKFRLMGASRLKFPKLRNPPPFLSRFPECNLEDIGFFSSNLVELVLDMIEPLEPFGEYKLNVIWSKQKDVNNFVDFQAMSTENNGEINDTLINYQNESYRKVKNTVSKMHQTHLSMFQNKPYLGPVNIGQGFQSYKIFPAISSTETLTEKSYKIKVKIDQLKQEASGFSSKIHPFFYIRFLNKTNSKNEIDVAQLTYVQSNSDVFITKPILVAKNTKRMFVLTWSVENPSSHISAAFYLIKLKSISNDKCHFAYIITCRTCHKNFMQAANKSSKNHVQHQASYCLIYKKIQNYFDAVTVDFQLEIGPVPKNTIFEATVEMISSVISKPRQSGVHNITLEFWDEYKNAVVAVICIIIAIIIVVGVVCLCRKLCQDPKKTDPNTKTVTMTDLDNDYDEEG